MRIIPKLKSFDIDLRNNLYIKILLDFIEESDLDFAQKYINSLIFVSLEKELHFPIYKMQKDEIIFQIDPIGLQRILENGLAWHLKLKFQIDKDIVYIDVLNAENGNYVNSLFFTTQNNEKAKLNIYFNDERDISLITFYKKTELNIIDKVTSVECEDNELIIKGIINKNAFEVQQNLFLLALPGIHSDTEEVKKYRINTFHQDFEVSIPLDTFSPMISEYHLLLGCIINDELKVSGIPFDVHTNGYLLSYFPEKSDSKGENIYIKPEDLFLEKKVSPIINNITIEGNSIIISGKLNSLDEKLLEHLQLRRCLVKHRMTGYFSELENIIFHADGSFSIRGDINKQDYFSLNGVYDLILTIEQNEIVKNLKVSYDLPQKRSSSMVVSPIKYIFTKNNIKSIRPYLTEDYNLSFVVYNIDSIHEINKIEKTDKNIKILCKIKMHDNGYQTLNVELISAFDSNLNYSLNTFSQNGNELSVVIDSDCLGKNIRNYINIDLNIKVTYKIGGNIYTDYLVSENGNEYFARIYPVYNFADKKNIYVFPFYNIDRKLMLKVGKNTSLYITKIVIDNKNLFLKIRKIKGISLTEGSVIFLGSDNKEYNIPAKVRTNQQDETDFEVKINFANLKEKLGKDKYILYFQTLTDVYKKSTFPLMIVDESVLNQAKEIKYKDKDYSITVLNKNKNLVVELKEETPINGNLGLSWNLKIKNILAKFAAKLARAFKKEEVWLIGENLGQIARDNGLAFFRYCYRENIPEDFYFVAKDNNYDIEKLRSYSKKVVIYDSFKHFYLYHLSKYLIVSHGIRDVIPTLFHSKIRENKKSVIYLQHGIIAMKKLFFNSKSYNGKIKKFVVSSTQEKDILINQMNFKENQVMITGLARFDFLNPKDKDKKEILWMPTWREWLIESDDNFLDSKFFKNYSGLLNNMQLNRLLQDNDVKIKFVLHVEMLKYARYFKTISDYIEILSPDEVDIQDLIKTSKMLITDYSSIAFDFAFQNKPIMFYQFDLEDYLIHRGSYVDMNKDLPGYQVKSDQHFISKLEEIIKNDFIIENAIGLRKKKYFDYVDKENCKRIYNEIKNLGG